ncbi:hypothetical protein WR25_05399 [Diploscapter pachys]|uniref:SLC41A/MgtE integral membrane domain-containing protein n=1 Tax=Diploscapter pachys TaxID=2018661 RepID=A0A2A2K9W3_9BILA|nr:hypothetical protein WR25_05399 [Diploscapter pachys]
MSSTNTDGKKETSATKNSESLTTTTNSDSEDKTTKTIAKVTGRRKKLATEEIEPEDKSARRSSSCEYQDESKPTTVLSKTSILSSLAFGELPIDVDFHVYKSDKKTAIEDETLGETPNEHYHHYEHAISESDALRAICMQSMLPFFLAGLGSIGSGVLSECAIKDLPLITKMMEFLAVYPPLAGMKGNLDSTFSSRLSTMAQANQLTPFKKGRSQVLRHMAMIQFQAVVLSVFACAVAFFLDMLESGKNVNADHYMYMASAAVFAMPINCAFSTTLLTCLVVWSRRCGFNPDNLATPLANSIGDLMTIGLVLGIAHALRPVNEINHWVPFIIASTAILICPVWLYFTRNDADLLHMERWQWFALIPAILLSGGSGFLQHYSTKKFLNFPLFLPLITGIAGNRVAVQASRMSTALNLRKNSIHSLSTRLNPIKYYLSNANESATARLLVLTSVPFQLVFVGLSFGFAELAPCMHINVNGWFILGYLAIAFIQVGVMLFVAQLFVYFLWSIGANPDSYAIPLLTATADLTGSSLLAALFNLLALIGGKDPNGYVLSFFGIFIM